MEIEFQLTADHIARGQRESCVACPYALALTDWATRHLNTSDVFVTAGASVIIVQEGSTQWRMYNPPEMMDDINNFDDGKDIQPKMMKGELEELSQPNT